MFGKEIVVQTAMLHVRVDEETKRRATETLGEMGLSVSEAVRLFLHRVARDGAFPFDLKVPNAPTRAAMADADGIARAKNPRFRNADELLAGLDADAG